MSQEQTPTAPTPNITVTPIMVETDNLQPVHVGIHLCVRTFAQTMADQIREICVKAGLTEQDISQLKVSITPQAVVFFHGEKPVAYVTRPLMSGEVLAATVAPVKSYTKVAQNQPSGLN